MGGLLERPPAFLKKKMTEKSVCGIIKIWIRSMKADQEWKVVFVLYVCYGTSG